MAAAASIRKNLTFLICNHSSNNKKNVHSCISHPVSLSLSLHFFSTQTRRIHFDTSPTVYDILVHKHDFPREFASRVASELSCVENLERVDSMLSFLKSSGFSNAHLQKILKYNPRFLCWSVEDNIKPKIKGFQDEGFSSADISVIVSRSPRILRMSLNNNIIPSLSVLKGLLGSNTALVRVVRRAPRLLSFNMEKAVVPNVEFLKSCGLSMHRIRIILNGYPHSFWQKPECMLSAVDKAKEMGLSAASKPFLYAIATIVSMSNKAWEVKLQGFRYMGFSESDILSMFRKEPRVFSVSTEKTKKITEGLVATGKFDISSIVHYPVSLMYSFEKRYEPRLRILSILQSRNLIENWPPLHTISSSSDAEFLKSFVSPHLEQLSDVDIPKLSGRAKHLG